MSAPNPPAFPFGDNGLLDGAKGMSLRDYFAAHCPSDLTEIGKMADAVKIAGEYPPETDVEGRIKWNNKVEAYLRYSYADSMLKERAK